MEYVKLGRTGLEVSRICLGSSTLFILFVAQQTSTKNPGGIWNKNPYGISKRLYFYGLQCSCCSNVANPAPI